MSDVDNEINAMGEKSGDNVGMASSKEGDHGLDAGRNVHT